MARQPLLHLGVLVRCVVVRNQVEFLVRWRNVIDYAQEFQPFLMTVPAIAHTDHGAVQCVHCSEQRGGSVAFVVLGHGPAATLLHRESRLRPIQCLNLALLVRAQHNGMLRRAQIESNDGLQFLGEVRIVADLEGACQMRLQPMLTPYPKMAERFRPESYCIEEAPLLVV